MTLPVALAIVGGLLLGAIAGITLLFLDHLARTDGNDEENYPSE